MLKRINLDGRYYFITAVTHNRQRILLRDVDLFWKCWAGSKPAAWVIIPDHFHFIIKISQIGISELIHDFKISFSKRFHARYGGKGKLWQSRFWDHIIRDQDDMNRHIDYIHYNPVKHHLVNDPFAYKYSSLIKYYEKGFYEREWGVTNKINFDGSYGECPVG